MQRRSASFFSLLCISYSYEQGSFFASPFQIRSRSVEFVFSLFPCLIRLLWLLKLAQLAFFASFTWSFVDVSQRLSFVLCFTGISIPDASGWIFFFFLLCLFTVLIFVFSCISATLSTLFLFLHHRLSHLFHFPFKERVPHSYLCLLLSFLQT
jgi:hypothetical protein